DNWLMVVSNPRILIIEDDTACVSALRRGLNKTYATEIAFQGETGLRKAQQANYDAILLDMHLPDMPGLVFCQRYRETDIKTPVLVITGDNSLERKVSMLNAGAD